jgi:hypothetical protein
MYTGTCVIGTCGNTPPQYGVVQHTQRRVRCIVTFLSYTTQPSATCQHYFSPSFSFLILRSSLSSITHPHPLFFSLFPFSDPPTFPVPYHFNSNPKIRRSWIKMEMDGGGKDGWREWRKIFKDDE